MTFTTMRTALLCALLAGASSGALAAQTARPQTPPEPVPPIERPTAQPPVEPPDEQPPRYRRPVFRMLQDFTLRAGEVVPYLTVVLGDAVIEGRVNGDVVVVLGSARLADGASIGGSLVVVGGTVTADATSRVGGELVVVVGRLNAPSTFSAYGDQVIISAPPWLDDILGDVSPWFTRGLLLGRMIVPDLEWVWTIVIVFFLIYLALNTVFDRAIATTADVMVERPVGSFLAGLLMLLLAVPVLLIVAATVIGLAIFPFLACGLVVAGLMGKTAVARAMGRSVLRTASPEGRIAAFMAFIIGFALLTLAYMVPLLGFVAWALTSVLGLGAATVAARGHLRRERRVAAPVPAAPAPSVAAPAPVAAAVEAPPAFQAPVVEEVPPIPPPPPPPPLYVHGLAQYPRATFFDRLAAFVLDCLLVGVANALLFDNRGDDGAFWFLLLVYHIAFWAWKGTTLGGIICNVKVTRTDGGELRFQDALVRGLSAIFSIAALGIGFFWMLQDPERQTWHDKIAGTLVVKVPRHVVMP